MQNVVWALPDNSIQVTYLSALNGVQTSQAFVTANRSQWPAAWRDVAYDLALPDWPMYCTWNGTAVVQDMTKIVPALAAQITQAIDELLRTTAKAWGYTDQVSIATYLTSTTLVFQHQAQAFVAWRDAIWTQVYADQAAVKAGTKAPPITVAQYMATLPTAPAMPVA